MKSYSKKRHTGRLIGTLLIFAILVAYVGTVLLLPVKTIGSTHTSQLKITTPSVNLPWPKYGEGAIGLSDGVVVQAHGNQTPRPTASVAKLITALSVLHKYPLSVGEQGPTITIDTTDYAYYTNYISEQGSVVPVSTGEQLSELQMLEAMLIPSGNNIADALARWAYGSLPAYDQFANGYVKQLGLKNTTVATDASGFSPNTTSTASNLIKLGSLVMANPVLAQIVAMKTVNVPNVGVMKNYDNVIGLNGINGIKTGNSNQAGGVFLGSANTKVNGQTITVLVALMGAPNLSQVMTDTLPMVVAVENSFAQSTLVSKSEVLGEYKLPWGGIVQVAAAKDLVVYVLQGQAANATLTLSSLNIPAAKGARVGTITTKANRLNQGQSVNVITLEKSTNPTWQWRLLHPQAIL